jgi:hypothetical protein
MSELCCPCVWVQLGLSHDGLVVPGAVAYGTNIDVTASKVALDLYPGPFLPENETRW